ncbi:MAG: nitronate monooxygenase [Salinibacterium sp.]|nr:nitronate monooxygenase [Salinibacterium sp.]
MSSPRWCDTPATRVLGLRIPIMLGAFGGVSSVALTAAVSNSGGLGAYGLYGYDGERILATARELAAATTNPLALNLWLPHDGDHGVRPDAAEFDSHVAALAGYFDEVGLPLPQRPHSYLPPFDEQFEAVLEAGPAVVSFVFGVPSREVVGLAREAGIITMGTATTVAEAVALEAGGVEVIIASGMEAGGHRVSFLDTAENSLVGTFALIPQVVDAVGVPVIAAGGIADGRGVAAALTLGASGVQVGSAFLATEQSAAAPGYRAALRGPGGAQTVLTRAPSGRLARGIRNRLTEETQIAPFPVQNWITGRFRSVAAERDLTDIMSLWAGQASPLIAETDARALVDRLVSDATPLLPA